MSEQQTSVLLVDPSLFTAPYDAALDAGLTSAGVRTCWAIRPPRAGQPREIPREHADEFFYRRVDDASFLPSKLRALAKGLSHIAGLAGLVARVWRRRPDVVHFQWAAVPLLDSFAMTAIRWRCPIVLTVHDTTPYNGESPHFGADLGFDLPMRLADRLIVHTDGGRQALLARGVPANKIAVVPHGPLALRVEPKPGRSKDPRWTFVAFGEMKPYKGLDLLIEATALVEQQFRERLRVVIAGRPRMDIEPLRSRIRELALGDVVEIHDRRLSEQEMADLFDHTDTFVFPYRQIDASGVYFLVRSLGRWMIASRVGIFAEALQPGQDGALVPPEDVGALAEQMADAVRRRPAARALPANEGWAGIGAATAQLYRDVVAARRGSASARTAESR